MKIIQHICFMFLFITPLLAQIDTNEWYPLGIGNYWEYADKDSTVHYSREVVGDTILSDGFQYSIILETYFIDSTSQKFYRRIENGTKVYTDSFLLFDFSLHKDENWQVYDWDTYFHRRAFNEGQEFSSLTKMNHLYKEFEDIYFDGADTAFIERKCERVHKGIGEVIIGSWGGKVELVKAKIGNQIYTTESLAEYYPLQIGNKWLYKTKFFDVGTTPEISYHLKEVVGDTLMTSGKKYFIIEYDGRKYFERFDSTANEIIRYEDWGCNKTDNPIYSLNYIINHTVEWTYCDEVPYLVTYSEPLGPDSAIIQFDMDYLVIEKVGFRKHLGLIYRSSMEISYASTTLIGAEIDGQVWGTLTDINDQDDLEYDFNLSQNNPNPFNPTTTIEFTVGTPPHPSPYPMLST